MLYHFLSFLTATNLDFNFSFESTFQRNRVNRQKIFNPFIETGTGSLVEENNINFEIAVKDKYNNIFNIDPKKVLYCIVFETLKRYKQSYRLEFRFKRK